MNPAGKRIYLIAAVDQEFGLGKDNELSWSLRKEMKHFTSVTKAVQIEDMRNAVIMGRNTWMSIPEKYRPLPGRHNVVLTRSTDFEAEGAQVAHSLEEALSIDDTNIETLFIIGGGAIYSQAIEHEWTDGIYLTHIEHTYDCDVFFPQIPERFSQVEELGRESEQGVDFTFKRYTTI